MRHHICFQGAPPPTSAPAHLPPCCATPAASGVSSRQEGEAADLTRVLSPVVSDSETSDVPAADGDRGAFRHRQRFAITERDLLRGYGNAAPWRCEP